LHQGLPVPTVGTSMAVTITHVFLWGSRATNHIEKALMGSLCLALGWSDNLFSINHTRIALNHVSEFRR